MRQHFPILKSLGTVALGNGFLQACGLLLNILLIRLLAAEAYGGFALVQSTVAFGATLFSAGIALATTRTVASISRDTHEVAAFIKFLYRVTGILGLGGGLACAICSQFLAVRLFHHADLHLALAVSGALVFANILNGIQVGAMQGLQEFQVLNETNVARGVIQLTLTSGGAWAGGLNGAVIGYSIAGLIGCGINWYRLGRILPRKNVNTALLAEVKRTGFFAVMRSVMASQLVNVPVPWLINVILLRSEGGLRQVAYLNICRQILQATTFIPEVMSQIALPKLTNAYAIEDRRGFVSTIRLATIIQLFPVICIATFLITLAAPIAGFFKIGADVSELLFCVVGAQAFFYTLSLPYGSILWATNRTREAFIFAVIRAVCSLALVWLFRDRGALGAITALSLTLAAQFLLIVAPRVWIYYVSGWPVKSVSMKAAVISERVEA